VDENVYYWPVEPVRNELEPLDLRPGLVRLGRALRANGAARTWALKVHLGARHRPAEVNPQWSRAVAELLADGGKAPHPDSFIFDTLSITTQGLDEAVAHLDLARDKGYVAATGLLPYVVADGPDEGKSLLAELPADSILARHTLAGGLDGVDGLAVLTPIRPHPHLGLRGAVSTLGVGLADRAGKIALHQDIRPQVDTQLCAGCGECMTVCLFDAIQLNAGRAFIDHTRCTGCGECMNVCFMAGIGPEETAGVPRFQAKVADAALAASNRISGGNTSRRLFFNFLVRLDRQSGGARTRKRERLGDIGVLAALDPVALDRATVDLISERMGGKLSDWSGFNQSPDAMLARAESIGLGQTAYDLVTV